MDRGRRKNSWVNEQKKNERRRMKNKEREQEIIKRN